MFTWPNTQQLYMSVVDARSGSVLYRQSLTSDDTGTATAWEFYPSDLVPTGANVANPVTFPVVDGAKLNGDNAHVWADVKDNNKPDPGEQIPPCQEQTGACQRSWIRRTPRRTAPRCGPARGTGTSRSAGGRTWPRTLPQVMYYLNKYHDHLAGAPYGFTPAAGNFEAADGDPVEGNAIDGAQHRRRPPRREPRRQRQHEHAA